MYRDNLPNNLYIANGLKLKRICANSLNNKDVFCPVRGLIYSGSSGVISGRIPYPQGSASNKLSILWDVNVKFRVQFEN